jgi:Sec7-like guanine-nucleotide exchange factor
MEEKVVNDKLSTVQEEKSLSEISLYVLLLAAAEVEITDNLKKKINKYLYQQYTTPQLKKEVKTLTEQGLLQDDHKISNKGKKYIKYKGYLPYVREIKQKKSDTDDRY